MFNILKWGQGPRPDLLAENLAREKAISEKFSKETSDGNKPKTGKKAKAEVEHKDRLAMIIALFQLLAPWIGGGILIFFLAVFLMTRIG